MENSNTQLPAEVRIPICPECGGLNGGHGNRRCSLMTLEYAQQEIINVEQKWIKINAGQCAINNSVVDRLKKLITFTQGKVAVLKAENNKLRKGATEYATKLHHAQQEIESLTNQLKGHAGVSNENMKLLQRENDKARTLLEKFISRHEAGLPPDRFIYNEIKTFLDGK
jgi:hypothetical protein